MTGFALVLLIVSTLALLHPYPVWPNYRLILVAILRSPALAFLQKMNLLAALAKDGLVILLLTIPHIVDRIFFNDWRHKPLNSPIFIVGQPRSGTTFLHRTLSDTGAFVSLPHFYWRFPFICVWWLVERLGLYPTIAKMDYWPATEAGRKANRIHEHQLGDFEEHGIFLEERLFHHYFLYRRYPLPEILPPISRYDHLPATDRGDMARHVMEVVRKFIWYKGTDKPWLTKENESVPIYRELMRMIPDARLLFVVRSPEASLPSYITLSVASTIAKTGIDPRRIPGWHQANMQFRADEVEAMLALHGENRNRNAVACVTYERFVSDLRAALEEIDRQLDLGIEPTCLEVVAGMQEAQNARQRGYCVDACEEIDAFRRYDEFVRAIE